MTVRKQSRVLLKINDETVAAVMPADCLAVEAVYPLVNSATFAQCHICSRLHLLSSKDYAHGMLSRFLRSTITSLLDAISR
jgi:hypothetical protein